MYPTSRFFAEDVMEAHWFRPASIERIMEITKFLVLNWDGRGGGSWFGPTYPGDKHIVRTNGAQDESMVHECAHVWYWDQEQSQQFDDDLVVDMFEAVHSGLDSKAHRVAKTYMDIMYNKETGKWNIKEIYAGFVSCCMGDIRMLPFELKPHFERLLQMPKVEKVYIPGVFA